MGDDRQDPALAQLFAVSVGVVTLVAQERVRAVARPTGAARDGWDAVDEGEGLGDVVDACRGGDDLQRGAASVADQMVFAACLPPVDRRRTGVGSPFFARTCEPSTRALDQSSSPAALSSASRTRCSCSKTPTCCHRSRRRQQVWPEPKPSSSGRSCQAMSLRRTYWMPCRHSRSATGRGPGDFSCQGGSSGSISAHKSSSTIHGRVLTPSRMAESSHRSRPTRALQQDRVTNSKKFSFLSDSPPLHTGGGCAPAPTGLATSLYLSSGRLSIAKSRNAWTRTCKTSSTKFSDRMPRSPRPWLS